jgi:hypothetical protein
MVQQPSPQSRELIHRLCEHVHQAETDFAAWAAERGRCAASDQRAYLSLWLLSARRRRYAVPRKGLTMRTERFLAGIASVGLGEVEPQVADDEPPPLPVNSALQVIGKPERRLNGMPRSPARCVSPWMSSCPACFAGMRTDQLSVIESRTDDYSGFRRRTGDANTAQQDIGGVQLAEVSVDTETGAIRVERLVAVQDCGRPINPKPIESQVRRRADGRLLRTIVEDDGGVRIGALITLTQIATRPLLARCSSSRGKALVRLVDRSTTSSAASTARSASSSCARG